MYEAKHSVEPISISAYGHIKPKQTLEVVLVRSSDEHVTIAGTPELVTKILELMK